MVGHHNLMGKILTNRPKPRLENHFSNNLLKRLHVIFDNLKATRCAGDEFKLNFHVPTSVDGYHNLLGKLLKKRPTPRLDFHLTYQYPASRDPMLYLSIRWHSNEQRLNPNSAMCLRQLIVTYHNLMGKLLTTGPKPRLENRFSNTLLKRPLVMLSHQWSPNGHWAVGESKLN